MALIYDLHPLLSMILETRNLEYAPLPCPRHYKVHAGSQKTPYSVLFMGKFLLHLHSVMELMSLSLGLLPLKALHKDAFSWDPR